MDEDQIGSEAQAIIEFAGKRCEPRLVDVTHRLESAPAFIGHDKEGVAYIKGTRAILDEWLPAPRRRRGTIIATTIDSFVDLVNRDSGENSIIFADNGPAPKLVAVLNFHASGFDGTPAFCDSRVEYAFPLSDEWKAWLAGDGERNKMQQGAFAEFIEDRLFDIGEPGSAGGIAVAWAEKMGVKLAGPNELMRVSRGLSVRVEETVRNVVKRESGESEFVFTVEHKDGAEDAPVRVPTAFHIRIPILRGEGTYSIPVRLRYRVGGGKVVWFYELHRPELFLFDAVAEAIARVRLPEEQSAEGDALAVPGKPPPVGCGLMVVMGTPPTTG